MSAHRIYCYSPQRPIVEDFLKSVGAIITHDCPHTVFGHEDLLGLESITFAVVDHHSHPIPQRMWETLIQRGAKVIHIDDQFRRARRAPRVNVTDYGASRESPRPAAD